MSSTGIKAQRSDTADKTNTAGVIADAVALAAITRSLQAQALEVAAFNSVARMLKCAPRDPSVIVLWLEDTISAISQTVEPLLRRFEQAPLVIVCAGIERWEIRAALMAGVAGVVLFEDLESALGPCAQAVRAGQICVPRANRRQIDPPALSAREKQILGLVVMGYMNSEIAQRLFVAESTVKSHLSSVFGKLGVRSRNEAVNLILDPQRGLGMGILALGGEPLEPAASTAQ
ncbi:MAG: LuxR C-terminal-related transcriptional regulator [Solirubrobacteraceae bacterium]